MKAISKLNSKNTPKHLRRRNPPKKEVTRRKIATTPGKNQLIFQEREQFTLPIKN